MNKVKTLKDNRPNNIYTLGDMDDGLYIHYSVANSITGNFLNRITFQRGIRNEQGCKNGVYEIDLLEIVMHRLECMQKVENSSYNELALYNVMSALEYLYEKDDKDEN